MISARDICTTANMRFVSSSSVLYQDKLPHRALQLYDMQTVLSFIHFISCFKQGLCTVDPCTFTMSVVFVWQPASEWVKVPRQVISDLERAASDAPHPFFFDWNIVAALDCYPSSLHDFLLAFFSTLLVWTDAAASRWPASSGIRSNVWHNAATVTTLMWKVQPCQFLPASNFKHWCISLPPENSESFV